MKFGPGTFKIGETGAEIDASCAVNSLKITVDKSEDDGKTMLCGTQKPGKVTYAYSLSGNVDTDTEDPDGLFALAAAAPGSVHPFTFTPNTEGTSAAGQLVIDPLDFGGEEYGEDMNSDLEFTLVGAPVYTYPPAVPGGRPALAELAPLVVNGKSRAGAAELELEPAEAELEPAGG